MWALVDAHHFYVSCERLFQPRLKKRSIAILSGPQGCVISCSRDLKARGVEIGAPLFELRTIFRAQDTLLLKPNFELYGDLSARMMQSAAGFGMPLEVYSIDEAFLDLGSESRKNQASMPTKMQSHFWNLAQQISRRIEQETGIPVGVAIAPTKLLAKLAMRSIKRGKEKSTPGGYTALFLGQELDELLDTTPVEKLWGVGKALKKTFAKANIWSAKDLRDMASSALRKRFGVTVERMVLELQGVNAVLREERPQKQIVATRSYPARLKSAVEVQRALMQQLQRACKKARQKGRLATICSFFVQGSSSARVAKNHPMIYETFTCTKPSADPLELLATISPTLKRKLQVISSASQEDLEFYRVGILLQELTSKKLEQEQGKLFDQEPEKQEAQQRRDRLYETLDSIQAQYGAQALTLGPRRIYAEREEKEARGRLSDDGLHKMELEIEQTVQKSSLSTRAWERLPEVS